MEIETQKQIESQNLFLKTSQTVVPKSVAPNLSDFTDYRLYMKSYYNFQKLQFRNYSYATFSAAADIKSPNYLKLVIDGKRNLSEDMIVKFARGLRLNKAQLQEYQALVRYTQEEDPSERNRFLTELNEIRLNKQLQSGELNQEAYDKVPNWVAWVIYEMADQAGVSFEPEKIRELLKRKVKLDDVKKAIDQLFKIGQLKKEADSGRVSKVLDQNKTMDIPVASVKKLQEEFIYLALESLHQDAPTEREISAVTLTLTEKEFEQLRFDLRQLRKRYHKDTAVNRLTTPGDRVYQLNLQLFPLT